MIGSRYKHFEIQKLLGRGGMGEVYLAVDSNLERRVALKFLPRTLTGDRTAQARLVDEARSCSVIQHPNVAVIHSVEEDGGVFAICMEYVRGETLRQILDSGLLPPNQIIDVSLAIARGVAAAHEHGIIHRDLKPANVILTEKGQVKVMDFGLALRPERSVETSGPESFGTVAYMSPEQARGAQLTIASDIFAFGSMLYEMITGVLPFHGENDLACLHAIISSEPRPIRETRRDLAPGLERLVRGCMAKSPTDRYASLEEVVATLERLSGDDARSPKDLISELSSGLETDSRHLRPSRAIRPVPGKKTKGARPNDGRRASNPAEGRSVGASPGLRRGSDDRRPTPISPTPIPGAPKSPPAPGVKRAAPGRGIKTAVPGTLSKKSLTRRDTTSAKKSQKLKNAKSRGASRPSTGTRPRPRRPDHTAEISATAYSRGGSVWKTVLGIVFALALTAGVVFVLTRVVAQKGQGSDGESSPPETSAEVQPSVAPATPQAGDALQEATTGSPDLDWDRLRQIQAPPLELPPLTDETRPLPSSNGMTGEATGGTIGYGDRSQGSASGSQPVPDAETPAPATADSIRGESNP